MLKILKAFKIGEKMDEKVYIIILNWNGWQDTIECLESVFRNSYKNFQVIVCDNCSENESLIKIKLWADGKIEAKNSIDCRIYKNTSPPIRKPLSYVEYNRLELESLQHCHYDDKVDLILLQTGDNLGFAGGNNVGIRYALQKADFSYIWLLNNDTVVDKNALTQLVLESNKDTRIGLCGSLLRYYQRPEEIQALNGAYNKYLGTSRYNTSLTKVSGIDYVVGASMLVSKKFLDEIGLLGEDYFLYYEELDWVMRSKGKFRQAYAMDSIVYHKEGATIGGKNNPSNKSELADFYAIKNRIVFARKYFPWSLPIVYMGVAFAIFNRIKRKQYSRAKMIIDIVCKMPKYYFHK